MLLGRQVIIILIILHIPLLRPFTIVFQIQYLIT